MVTCKHPIGRDERTGYTLLTTAMWEMLRSFFDEFEIESGLLDNERNIIIIKE